MKDEIMDLIANDNKIGYLPRRPGFHAMVLLEMLGQPFRQANGLPLTLVPDEHVRASIAAIQV